MTKVYVPKNIVAKNLLSDDEILNMIGEEDLEKEIRKIIDEIDGRVGDLFNPSKTPISKMPIRRKYSHPKLENKYGDLLYKVLKEDAEKAAVYAFYMFGENVEPDREFGLDKKLDVKKVPQKIKNIPGIEDMFKNWEAKELLIASFSENKRRNEMETKKASSLPSESEVLKMIEEADQETIKRWETNEGVDGIYNIWLDVFKPGLTLSKRPSKQEEEKAVMALLLTPAILNKVGGLSGATKEIFMDYCDQFEMNDKDVNDLYKEYVKKFKQKYQSLSKYVDEDEDTHNKRRNEMTKIYVPKTASKNIVAKSLPSESEVLKIVEGGNEKEIKELVKKAYDIYLNTCKPGEELTKKPTKEEERKAAIAMFLAYAICYKIDKCPLKWGDLDMHPSKDFDIYLFEGVYDLKIDDNEYKEVFNDLYKSYEKEFSQKYPSLASKTKTAGAPFNPESIGYNLWRQMVEQFPQYTKQQNLTMLEIAPTKQNKAAVDSVTETIDNLAEEAEEAGNVALATQLDVISTLLEASIKN